MSDIEIGSVVKLKSGGPWMTVTACTEGSKIVRCMWFNGNKLENDSFDVRSLQCRIS